MVTDMRMPPTADAERIAIFVLPTNTTLEVPRRTIEPVDSHLIAADLETSQWSESIAAEQSAGAKKGGKKEYVATEAVLRWIYDHE